MSQKSPRLSEDTFKRWLAVLIAFVALLVALTTYLQGDVSAQAARLNREAQEYAIRSTGMRARGQQQVAYSVYEVSRDYDELRSQAQRLRSSEPLRAQAYITASEQITPLSPLLGDAYAKPRESDGWRLPDYGRYEADTWVVTATLLSEQREAAANEANAWDSKSNNYVAALAIYAGVLFLLGLATTLSGCVRWLFVLIGVGLMVGATAWVIGVWLSPVYHIPTRAMEKYAQAYGYLWQEKYDEAIRLLDEAIAIDRDYANAYKERGGTHLHEKTPRLDLAIQDYLTALDKGASRYEIYWNLGAAYFRSGEFAKSIPYSQQALAVNSQICGPAFNLGLAQLALGDERAADKAYEEAIARCQKILDASLAAGLGAPWSLWGDIQRSINVLEDLMCHTNQRYCYPDRVKLNVERIAHRQLVLMAGEKYRRRMKEALVALEYYHTATVKPSGGKQDRLRFGNLFYAGNEVQSNVERERFPYYGFDIYAFRTYSNMRKDIHMVWKVYRDGKEQIGLRYAYPWELEESGAAQRLINSRTILRPGRYEVEVYGNGELMTTGAFEVDVSSDLPTPLPANARPTAPVSVGNLLFADDFANNHHGWWTGDTDRGREVKIANGAYEIVTHIKDDFWRTTCFDCGLYDDVYVEANTRYVAGPTDWGYGLIVRADAGMDNLYEFLINGNGSYIIGKVSNGKFIPLVDWTRSNLVRPRGENRLAIGARGSTLEFFINGQSVRRLTDTTLTKGYFGASVGVTDLVVAFSQLRAWQAR
jgi:tetratricopeptide (TPR) repeat protein